MNPIIFIVAVISLAILIIVTFENWWIGQNWPTNGAFASRASIHGAGPAGGKAAAVGSGGSAVDTGGANGGSSPPPPSSSTSNSNPSSSSSPSSSGSSPSSQCPSGMTWNAVNQNCVTSLVTCSDGSIVDNQSLCPQQPAQQMQQFVCSDGSVVSSSSLCPTSTSGGSSGSSSSSHHSSSSHKTSTSNKISKTAKADAISCISGNITSIAQAVSMNTSRASNSTFLNESSSAVMSCVPSLHSTPLVGKTILNIVTPTKVTIQKHSKHWLVGFRYGKSDGLLSGIRDSVGSCGPPQNVSNLVACNQGYTIAFNAYCKVGKFGCNS